MAQINDFFKSIKLSVAKNIKKLKYFFIKNKTNLTTKKDLDFKNLSIVFFGVMVLFLALGMLMPSEDNRVFRQIAKDPPQKMEFIQKDETEQKLTNTPSKIWGNGASSFSSVLVIKIPKWRSWYVCCVRERFLRSGLCCRAVR